MSLAILSGNVAGDGDSGFKQFTLVMLVFIRNSRGNRFQALEAGGRFEVGALLTAMQRGGAFRAVALEIYIPR